MRVLRIVGRDFLSYEYIDLDLSAIRSAAITGPVGSGKSSLFEAITWCVWGKANRATVIRDDCDETMVQVDFTARGEHCTVIRTIRADGRGSSLAFIVSGVNRAQHIMKETQAAIDRQIGLDYDSIVSGPFMIQMHTSHLMEAAPSERKEILIRLFGVDRFEPYHREADRQRGGYAREAESLLTEQDALRATAADLPQALSDVSLARIELSDAIVARERSLAEMASIKERQITLREQARHADTLRQTISTLGQRIEDDQKEHSRVLRQLSEAHQIVDTPEPAFDALVEVSAEDGNTARFAYHEMSQTFNLRTGIESQLPLLRQQLDRNVKLAGIVDTVPCGGEGIYATCRFLINAPKASDITAQEQAIEGLEKRLATLPTAAALADARAYSDGATARYHAYQQETLRRESLKQQWSLKVNAARETVKSGKDNLQRIQTQIERDQSVLRHSQQQLASLQTDSTQMDMVEVQLRSLKAQTDEQTSSIDMVYQPAVSRAEARRDSIEEAVKAIPSIEKQLKETNGKLLVYTRLAKAFHRDGIPTLILENGIPIIEAYANEVLDRMPDKYRLRILTQREKKKGGMADRVDVVVERPGGKVRAYANLSGGQKFRVDFALRIALGRALSQRSGATIDTLALDEGWGTQDKKGVEALLESLSAVQDQFGLVLVISHHEAVIETWETRITADLSDEGTSSLTLVA